MAAKLDRKRTHLVRTLIIATATTVLVLSGAYTAAVWPGDNVTPVGCREAAIAAANAEMEVLLSTPYAHLGVSPDDGDVVYISPTETTGYNEQTDTLRQRTFVLSDNGTAETFDDLTATITATAVCIDGVPGNDTVGEGDDCLRARVAVTWKFLNKQSTYTTADTYLYRQRDATVTVAAGVLPAQPAADVAADARLASR